MESEFIQGIVDRAREHPKRIAFPEAENKDILRTAAMVAGQGIGTPVLVGNEEAVRALLAEMELDSASFEIFDHTKEENRAALTSRYLAGNSDFSEKAVMRKTKDPLRCAMFLLKAGMVDCVAGGKEYSTGDVVFEAISIVGLKEGVESPSSLGIAEIPGFEGPQGPLLALADCAITAQPDAKDLAGIALASADTVRSLLGWEPRIAMLSFSTLGSAEHESIDVIREAVRYAKEQEPDLLIDGEFQLDSAILPKTAAKKVKRESGVAGKANVLIFPNLHAGNIGVKLIQIFGHANAYGPVLQGFCLPVCDFSRSAPVEEMFGNVAMLVVRAEDGKEVL